MKLHLQKVLILTCLVWLSSCNDQFAFMGTEPLILPISPLQNAAQTISSLSSKRANQTVSKISANKVVKKSESKEKAVSAKQSVKVREAKKRITFARPIKKIIKVGTKLEALDVKKIVVEEEKDLSEGTLNISFNEYEHHGFEIKPGEVVKPSTLLAAVNLDSVFKKLAKLDSVNKDEVKLAQAAPKKVEEKKIEKPEEDDLVVFDYSKIKEEQALLAAPKENFDSSRIPVQASLSRTVQDTIQRELGEMLTENKSSTSKKSYRGGSSNRALSVPKNVAMAQQLLKPASLPKPTYSQQENKLIIRGSHIRFDGNEGEKIYDFDYRPAFSASEYSYPDKDGAVVLVTSRGMKSTAEGRILSRGSVPTKISLSFPSGINEYSVPILDMNGFNAFLDERELDGREGFILVSLTEQVKNLDVNDPKYEARIFLDEKFTVTESVDESAYVLFVGVRSGNNILTIETNSGNFADKIVFVSEGEVSFEVAEVLDSKLEKIAMYEKGPLSSKKSELSIDPSEFRPLGLDFRPQQDGLNTYLLKFPSYLTSSRKFLEFDHLADKIFVGIQDNTREIVLPTNEFIAQVFDRFQIDSLKQRCLVQVNLNKPIKEVKVEGESYKGPMALQIASLDSYGNLDDEVSDITEKIYVLGEYQGQFVFQFDYVDGTKQTFASYCSTDTYLLEHI